MDSGWEPPGYEALELLGFGSVGEVWRARATSGEVVALRRLQGVGQDELHVLRQQAVVVRSLPGSHLVRLRSVHGDVLVLDHAPGGSLASLLARRGRLQPGEVVTVVAPVAQALAEAHAAGLVHGHVGTTSVLLSADGMPLLDELGAGHLRESALGLDPSGVLGSAADVWALGALCQVLLTGAAPVPGTGLAAAAPLVPVPLVRAVEAALAFDPGARPGAGELAAMLLAACPPKPVRFPPGALPPAAPGPQRRTSHAAGRGRGRGRGRQVGLRLGVPEGARRKLLVGASVAAALGVVALTGWSWGSGVGTDSGSRIGGGRASSGRSAAAVVQVRPPDWTAVLGALDRARENAYAAADPVALAQVYVAGSAALGADSRQLRALAAQRRTAQGVRHWVVSVQALEVTEATVRLRVVEALQGGALLDERGAVVLQQPPTVSRTELVALRRTEAGWRVEQVRLPA